MRHLLAAGFVFAVAFLFAAPAQPQVSNAPPVASLRASVAVGASPLEVWFDASGSYDPDGLIVNVEWDLDGDGAFSAAPGPLPFAYAHFESLEKRTFKPAVRVTDNLGASATASATITIDPAGTAQTTPQTAPSEEPPETTAPPAPPQGTAQGYPMTMGAGDWLHSRYAPIPFGNGSSRAYQSSEIAAGADAVLSLVNKERQAAGLKPLSRDAHLELLAQAQARDMALSGFFDHTNTFGMGPKDRFLAINPPDWHYIAENIFAGLSDPSQVMDGWMNSPGHRANILNSEVSHIGVGVFYLPGDPEGYGWYWVQVFAGFDGDAAKHDWLDPAEVK